jgi:diguanylate cyclase (GGDEF)-like protein
MICYRWLSYQGGVIAYMVLDLKSIRKIPISLLLMSILFIVIPDFLDDYDQFYIDDMAWYGLLFPCFIFSYYLGLVGGFIGGILANAYHLFWFFFEKKFAHEVVMDESITLHLGICFITLSCSIGTGILSNQLKRRQKEIQRLNEKLMQMAWYDSLTGLPNRHYFMRKLEKSFKINEQVSLMFIDLDGFKKVNDRYGHEAGDNLLKDVSQKLQQIQDACTFVSRLGGDEFTLLLKDTDKDIVYEKAKNILSMLQMKFHDVQLSGSIGIAFYQSGDIPSTLLKNADTAMYNAKLEGKDTISFFN